MKGKTGFALDLVPEKRIGQGKAGMWEEPLDLFDFFYGR